MRLVKTLEPIGNNPLPKGFTEVEYLEANGSQYINTGLVSTAQSKVDVVYSFTTMESGVSNNNAIFGGRSSTQYTHNTFTLFKLASQTPQRFRFDYNGQTYIGSSSNMDWTTSSKFRFTYNGSTMNVSNILTGQSESTQMNPDTAFTTEPIYLFAVNTLGSAQLYLKGRIYHYWYTDGVTTIDLIPALDKTGKPCMYDLIGKQAYYNLGSDDDFTYGRKIIPIEYLESTGTQYIDTGVILSSTDKVKALAEYTGEPSSGSSYIFGTYGSSKNFGINADLSSGNRFYGVWYNQGTITSASPLAELNTKYKVEVSSNGIYINDILFSNVSGTFTGSNPVYLFWANGTGQPKSLMKLYSCQIWQGSTLVRDYSTCKDENNVGYMFDNVTHTCYLNAGSGAFVVGDNLYTKKLRLIRDGKVHSKIYTEVEYLESDGNQWLDTGYTINTATDEVSTWFQLITTDKYTWLMGEHDTGARFGIGSGDGTNLRNIAYGASTYKVNDTEVYNSQHYFNANSNGVYVNGTLVHAFENFASTSTIYLFNLNISGGGNKASGKIWRFSHKRNGVLIRDMIPVLDSNGVPAMLDKVSGQFFYNKGTGQFTYGHKIIPVKYLEADGTQYIDTGIVPINSTGVYAKMSYTDVNNKVTFGSMVSGNGFVGPYYASTSTFTGWWTRWGISEPRASASPTAGTIYEFFMNFNNDRIARVDNTIIASSLGTISGTFPNMTLFRRNFSSGYAYLLGRIYSAKMTDGSTLTRDFIPCKDENGVGYMFDKVTHSLFGNAGTGSFIVGDEVKNVVRFVNSDLDGYEIGEYIQSSGTQYIDTGVIGNQNTRLNIDFQLTNTSEIKPLFGSRIYSGSSISRANYFYTIVASGSSSIVDRFQFGYGSDSLYRFNVSNPSKKYNIDFDKNILKIDGVVVNTFTTQTFTTPSSILLFNCHTGSNGTDVDTRYGVAKVYYFKVWDNGILIRNFLPAKRKSDNAIGMLDVVNKVFYNNAGTGNFTFQPKG